VAIITGNIALAVMPQYARGMTGQPVGQRRRTGGLWRHRDFLRLWAGETVSLFGSQVTELALPLVAVYTLSANARQLGLLNARASRRSCW
jgi:hypothetical protein